MKSPLTGGIGLLERAIGYTLGSLRLVEPEALTWPTPCREWDLHALLRHMNDSLAALHEAVDSGHIELEPTGEPALDLVASLRARACHLLGACAKGTDRQVVTIADQSLTSFLVASAGAVEIAVHGWDVARACRQDRPIPATLAAELLPLTLFLVGDADRPGRFGPSAPVLPFAGPGELLVAFLGRKAC